MNTFIKYFSIITVLILLVEIVPNNSRSDVVISNNYPLNVSSISPNLYMETGPGYGNTNPPYPPTNSLNYFAVDGITTQSVYVTTNLPIYINNTNLRDPGPPPTPSPTPYILDVLEIVNDTNVKGIPVYIYFNTSYNNQNNKLPNGLSMYYSTTLPPSNAYTSITPGTRIHLTTSYIYISFNLSNSAKNNFELYLIFVINGVIITYSFPVNLNH